MSRFALYRNVRARDQLEIFLVSAVTSLLLVRLYLQVTGFPQIGGGGLHIAHMLFGGIFMLAALTVSLTFLGTRAQRLTALLGGIGFGVFIDEIGKFVTRDNDYFFKPAIGIIYAIFVILYLVFSFLSRRQRLSSREYQINTLAQFEEAVAHDMDPHEKQQAYDLLSRSSQSSHITQQLLAMLDSVETVRQRPHNWVERQLVRGGELYARFWKQRGSRKLVQIFFITESVVFLTGVLINVYPSLNSLQDLLRNQVTYGDWLIVGQLASALTAAGLAIYGAGQLRSSRLEAFEYFRRATLVNLLLTEFFIFSRIELGALPGFVYNLILLLIINASIAQEQREQTK